jgi:hypothetical protein
VGGQSFRLSSPALLVLGAERVGRGSNAVSSWVMKRHVQRGGMSRALPNKRSQATAGGRCSVNQQRRSPAAPEAQR